MRRIGEGLYAITVTLWAGSLWVSGCVVAPLLFSRLADRGLAGRLAGDLFGVVAWVGILCAGYLLVFMMARQGWRALRSGVCWVVIVMLALTLAGHFGVQPIMTALKAQVFPREVFETVLRDRFATWHGVASVLFLIQSLLGVALVLLQNRGLR